MLKRNKFLWFFFLSKGFDEKCKPTELALNFVKKQYFSLKKHFPLILIEWEQREPGKSCF